MNKSVGLENDIHILAGDNSPLPISTDSVGIYLYKILNNGSKNSKAMVDAVAHRSLLHSELLQQAINLAEALRYHNYQSERTVMSICSENSLDYFAIVLASLFNGSIIVPLNPAYTIHELNHALNISHPKVVFCSKANANNICELKNGNFQFIEKIIIMNDRLSLKDKTAPAGTQAIDDFIQGVLKHNDKDVNAFQPVDGDSSKMPALILCSSGTTGLPKGVTLSHLNLMVRLTHARDPRYYSQDQNERILGLLPFFHAYALSFILCCIASLQTVIMIKKFEKDLFLKTIQDYKVTILVLVPPLAIFLAKSDKIEKYDLSSVSDVICGAAPLSQSIEEELTKKLNWQRFRQALGMTECTSTLTMIGRNEGSKPGSCGKTMSFTLLKIRDPKTGYSMGANRVGELCWKGPLVMMGYYKDERATQEAFTDDGWFRSGDLGYYDREGFVYIVDRLKEIIKYKAFQIAPAELEAILLNHPKVEDVGVVGIPDELAGELPMAFVVKKHATDVGETELKTYVAGVVSPQKRLRGGVKFVTSIPRNPSGKILRRKLRDSLNDCRVNHNVESKL